MTKNRTIQKSDHGTWLVFEKVNGHWVCLGDYVDPYTATKIADR